MEVRAWVVVVTVLVGAAIGSGILWWNLEPPPPADAFIHSKPVKRRVSPLPSIGGPVAAPQYAPIPAASTGTPPKEAWLPRRLTDQEKDRRLAANQFYMKSQALRATMSNTSFLLGELANRQYDALQTQLDAAAAKAIADPAYESTEADIAEFADGNDNFPPTDQFLLDEWVKERPSSAWAHCSEALRWFNNAWRARGDGWAKDVPEGRWPKVERDINKARAEIHKTLDLNPKIPAAWVLLMDIDRMNGGLATATRDLKDGTAQFPAGFRLAESYETSLDPHWYGSYEQMNAFAKDESSKADVNPRLWALQGESDAGRGCSRCNNYDWSTGLTEYNRALAYLDAPTWLAGAGEAAVHLHRYALAYRYYERASQYDKADFKYVVEMQLMQALCDPKVDAFKFKVLASDARTYGGIAEMNYPRSPGDCVYYAAELPWGDEPAATAGNVQNYDIHMMEVMASFKPKQ